MTVTRPNGNAEESWRRPGDTEDTPPGTPAPGTPPPPSTPPAASTPPPPSTPPAASTPPPASGPPQGPGYTGPPATVPPPAGWRPPVEYEPAPPRELPPQDHAELDTAEQSARTVTLGVGVVVGAILLIAMCVLCSRAVL